MTVQIFSIWGNRKQKKPCYECHSKVVGLKYRDESITALGTICNPLWIDAPWRGLIGGKERLSECRALIKQLICVEAPKQDAFTLFVLLCVKIFTQYDYFDLLCQRKDI